MKAYAIVIDGDITSEKGYATLAESSYRVRNEFQLEQFNAVTPRTVDQEMSDHNVTWNYPWSGETIDFGTGLLKKAYTTANKDKRMACSMSHYLLWKKCKETNENILILEHDAVFTKRIDFDIDFTVYQVLGINNPIGATRRAAAYRDAINANSSEYQIVPWIDNDQKIPQGLAGNSAYIITPAGASELIDAVHNPQIGLWPNDALMCRQLFYFLGVTKEHYTKVQGLPSTTTL